MVVLTYAKFRAVSDKCQSPVEFSWSARSAGGRHRRNSFAAVCIGVGLVSLCGGTGASASRSRRSRSISTGRDPVPRHPDQARSFFSRGGHACKSGFLEAGTFSMHQSGPRFFSCWATPPPALFANRDEIPLRGTTLGPWQPSRA